MIFNVDHFGHFGSQICEYRDKTKINSSEIFDDWDDLCLFLYKDWRNMTTLCQKVNQRLMITLNIQQNVSQIAEFNWQDILKLPNGVQELIERLDKFYYNDPMIGAIDSNMTNIETIIRKFNNRAIVYGGEVKPTFNSSDILQEKLLEGAILFCMVYCVAFTIGIMMTDTRTLRKYLAVTICLIQTYCLIYRDNHIKKQKSLILNQQTKTPTKCQPTINPITTRINELVDGTFIFYDELKYQLREIEFVFNKIEMRILRYTPSRLELIQMIKMLQKTFEKVQSLAYLNQVTARNIVIESNNSIHIIE